MKYSNLLLAIFLITALFSCTDKDNQSPKPTIKRDVDLFIQNISDEGGRITNTLEDATSIVITIQTQAGEATDYTSYRMPIYRINEIYTTEKLSLLAGSYKITEFFLIDSGNNILFATPIEGSNQAKNVLDALPVNFYVSEEVSQPVNMEVISTENLTPEAFGLVRFTVDEVSLLNFWASISELGSDSLMPADITVTNEIGTYAITSTLSGNLVNNLVSVRGGFDKYRIQVNVAGYVPYDSLFLAEDLAIYENQPLIIELSKNVAELRILHSDELLYGISNAIVQNNEIHYVKFFDGSTIAGYPDANDFYYKLSLFNETGTVHSFESSAKGQSASQLNLTTTPNGNIAFAYRTWAGFSYAFDGFYKVWDGVNAKSEQVFDNANYGLYPRIVYGSDGSPHIVSFSAAGYHFLHHTKSTNWSTANLGNHGGWIGDYTAISSGDDIFVACRVNSQVKLFSYVNGSWSNENITSDTSPRTHGIFFDENGQLSVLYATANAIKIATKSGSSWSVAQVSETTKVSHSADVLLTAAAKYVSYKNDDEVVILKQESGQAWEQLYTFTDLNYKAGRTNDSKVSLLEVDGGTQLIFADHQNVYQVKVD